MVEFLQVNFVPVLFVGLLVFLMMGFPVAFSLAATGLATLPSVPPGSPDVDQVRLYSGHDNQ